MAATVLSSKAFDLAGGALREDLMDVIYDISPMETWFMTHASRGTSKSTTHEWLSDTLTAASSTNAFIEGDAYSAQARTLPTRLKNYTQISRKEFAVTGTAQKVDNAGMAELLAYHTARASRELKRDMESAMLGNNPASAGTSVSPRVSGAVQNWIHTVGHVSVNQTGATTTAPVSGFPTATIGAGTATVLTQAGLLSILQQQWSAGGDPAVILVGPTLYQSISSFTGLATRFRNVESRAQAQIIGAADVFVSPYGSHNIQLSRYASSTVVYALDMSTWSVDYLRSFQTIDIAKISDEERRMILVEWTLRCNAPLANAKATNMS
jgi:hypothetical protein